MSGSTNRKNGLETKTSQKVMNEWSEDDIEAVMPKLRHSYYYTKPTMEELAAKERAEPGYCGRVKDFVVGRHGVGSIRFLGETDLRGVDLDSYFEITPGRLRYCGPILLGGQGGFNNTAEMTMVTTKFTLEELGRRDIQALLLSKAISFKKRLEDIGQQFVLYNPINGEYKWRTKYISGLGFIGFEGKQETSNKKMTLGIKILMAGIAALSMCYVICKDRRPLHVLCNLQGP